MEKRVVSIQGTENQKTWIFSEFVSDDQWVELNADDMVGDDVVLPDPNTSVPSSQPIESPAYYSRRYVCFNNEKALP
ncbi:hypothetical protein HQ531_11715 [bacterium]|nr:hypothetical protein [bacterium]